MKRILFLVWVSLLFIVGGIQAQEVSSIENAFQKANLAALSSQMSGSVDLILPGDDRSVGKEECISAVTQFLRSSGVKDFSVVHEGSRGESKFIVGILKTSRGLFRVHLFFKKVNNQYFISQLRIEPSNE